MVCSYFVVGTLAVGNGNRIPLVSYEKIEYLRQWKLTCSLRRIAVFPVRNASIDLACHNFHSHWEPLSN